MPTYHLRRFMRPVRAGASVTDSAEAIEAHDDAKAVIIAQALAAEPDNALLAVELRDAEDRLVWSLRRGEIVSQRPGDVA